MTLHPAQ